jgi:cob(I)alamin adenosyltransferase
MGDGTSRVNSDPRDRRIGKARTGLVIVYTGEGKGKTTAALGLLLRAWGHGWRICVIQFIKGEGGVWGEVRAARRLDGVDWIKTGDGFTWTSRDIEETIARARHGWQVAQERILSGAYDLVILDEFTYALDLGWLDTLEVISWLEARRPPSLHLVITGRDAPSELIDYADLVTEMVNIRHPFDRGVGAQPGIEF